MASTPFFYHRDRHHVKCYKNKFTINEIKYHVNKPEWGANILQWLTRGESNAEIIKRQTKKYKKIKSRFHGNIAV